MKKTALILVAILISVLLLSCENSNSLSTETSDFSESCEQEILTDQNSYQETSSMLSLNSEKTTAVTQYSSPAVVPSSVEKVSSSAVITTTASAESIQKSKDTVVITVNCGTVLNNMTKLKDGKETFIPGNGMIINKTEIEFNSGETAFDALKKICDLNGVHFEYSYSPVFGTYYVEGINQLYEKDCGSQSGWLYKVNGEVPSVGCSSYKLEKGDSVEFLYTCNMGEDIGA